LQSPVTTAILSGSAGQASYSQKPISKAAPLSGKGTSQNRKAGNQKMGGWFKFAGFDSLHAQ